MPLEVMCLDNFVDLSHAVAPFLPRGGGAPGTLREEQHQLTMEEEESLAVVLD